MIEESELTVVEEKVRGHVWPPVPEGVDDYDRECEMDPFAVAIYANEIFNYYKQREVAMLLFYTIMIFHCTNYLLLVLM